jgi:hypothetical protein
VIAWVTAQKGAADMGSQNGYEGCTSAVISAIAVGKRKETDGGKGNSSFLVFSLLSLLFHLQPDFWGLFSLH